MTIKNWIGAIFMIIFLSVAMIGVVIRADGIILPYQNYYLIAWPFTFLLGFFLITRK